MLDHRAIVGIINIGHAVGIGAEEAEAAAGFEAELQEEVGGIAAVVAKREFHGAAGLIAAGHVKAFLAAKLEIECGSAAEEEMRGLLAEIGLQQEGQFPGMDGGAVVRGRGSGRIHEAVEVHLVTLQAVINCRREIEVRLEGDLPAHAGVEAEFGLGLLFIAFDLIFSRSHLRSGKDAKAGLCLGGQDEHKEEAGDDQAQVGWG